FDGRRCCGTACRRTPRTRSHTDTAFSGDAGVPAGPYRRPATSRDVVAGCATLGRRWFAPPTRGRAGAHHARALLRGPEACSAATLRRSRRRNAASRRTRLGCGGGGRL